MKTAAETSGNDGLRLLAAFILMAAGAGCSPVTSAAHPLGPERLQQIQAEVDGKQAEVTLQHPVAVGSVQRSRLTGRIFIEDATVRVVQQRNLVIQQPLMAVRQIDTSHRLSSGGMGLIVGAAGGGVIGGIVGAFTGYDCSGRYASHDCLSRSSAAGMMAVMGMIPGAVIGAIVGGAIGGGPIWRFSEAPSR